MNLDTYTRDNNPETPYFNEFKREMKRLRESTEIGNLYHQLFSVKSDEELEEDLRLIHEVYQGKNDCYKEVGKTEWFVIWHKSVRQCDYFTNLFGYTIVDKLTDEQRTEMNEVQKEYNALSKKVIVKLKYNHTEEDYAIHEQSYKTLYAMDEYKVLTSKLRKLKAIENSKEDISVAGKFDSMLHTAVYLDVKSELYKLFKRVFNYIETERELNPSFADKK